MRRTPTAAAVSRSVVRPANRLWPATTAVLVRRTVEAMTPSCTRRAGRREGGTDRGPVWIGRMASYHARPVSQGPPTIRSVRTIPSRACRCSATWPRCSSSSSSKGPVSWDAGRQLALSIATDGQAEPNVDPIERMRIEELARVAELQVAGRTGLETSIGGHGIRFVPVTRGEWASRTLDAYRPLFEELAGSLQNDQDQTPDTPPRVIRSAWMGPLMQMIGPMMLGMTAGSMVGHLAHRALGQYDLPIPRPSGDELLVVPANLDAFGEAWSLPLDDLRLWVCLHDVTHHAVLGVPHVGARITSLLHQYLAGFEASDSPLEDRLQELEVHDPSSMPDLQSLVRRPRVVARCHPVTATARAAAATRSDRRGDRRLRGPRDGHDRRRTAAELLDAHRGAAPATRRGRAIRSLRRALVRPRAHADPVRPRRQFIEGVVERAGDAALTRLWDDERNLPTPAEVDAPGLWLARIDLPDA